MRKHIHYAAAVLVAVLLATPMFAARGTANFSNFVALGDSYGAGFTGGSLNERHQVWSWPAVIARQAGLQFCAPGAAAAVQCFAQPLVSFPGIGPELQLTSVIPSPVITAAPGQGQPLLLNFGRPYNNLSIPGATVGALLSLTGAEPQTPNEPTAVSMGRFILRGLGTPVQQAIAQHPTFIALWIGGNDYLSVMFSGNPATITPAADFRVRYEALLNALVAGAPNAGMVVGNLPAAIPPYLALVPAYLVNPTNGQPVLIEGNRIYYMVDTGNGTQAPIAPTTLVPLQTRTKLAQGYGLPGFLKAHPLFASLPHVGEPLTQDDVLTQEEIQQVFTRVAEYNAIIQQLAAARDIPVADINGLFQRVSAPGGVHLGPITVTSAPVSGGFFGFDFFHLTDLGYLMFGNEYIRTINQAYDTEIPLASISQLFANNGAFFGDGAPGAADNLTFNGNNKGITTSALNQILTFWSQPTIKTTTRFRGVRH
ncbi:MAG TPA: SGNH/GDSL hydrolase family protein [Thermoanaerobaculia bacterium]|nr:SGNH/GDSL hydrolase family protein [Thermoanaerobaculia bacterium]